MEKKGFEIPVSDWSLVKIENAKFILNEAQNYVKYLSEVSQRITARAFSALTILVPITSALMAFVIREILEHEKINYVVYYSLVIVITLIYVMYLLGKIVMPRMYMPVGRSPKELCDDNMLGVKDESELSFVALVLNEIEACQVKIDYNEEQNMERKGLLDKSLKIIALIFITSTIIITVNICLVIL